MVRRALLFPLLILCACVPTFTPSDALTLTLDGDLLTLHSPSAFQRGSVGIRAAKVISPYCAAPECAPEPNGVVLLQLPEHDALYAAELPLATVEGFERAQAVVVLPRAREALVTELEAPETPKEPPGAAK